MSSLDDIKKKLSIDELDKDTRSAMFNKFVEKGGQVITEKKSGGAIKFNRDRQRAISEHITRKQEELKSRSSILTEGGSSESKKDKKKRPSFFVFLKGVFLGYFTFSKSFNKKFAASMKEEISDILSTLNFIAGQLISLDMDKKIGAVEILNKTNIFAYELLMRIYNLFKVNSITRIQTFFVRYNNILCPGIIDDIRIIYKELVVIYPYWESIKEALWKGVLVYQEITSKEPVINKLKINRFIDTIFNYFLPGFHITLSYNLCENVPYEYNYMKEFAKIDQKEDIGSLTKEYEEEKKKYIEQKEKEKNEMKQAFQESVDKREMEKIPKYTQKGLALIDSIVDRIPALYKTDQRLQVYEINEKALYFFVIFDEFDKEYSFILTTSQIKLTPRLEAGKRVDIKADFDELNIKYNEINSFIREYTLLLEQYRKVSEDFKNSPLALQQKQANINLKRAQTFNEMRSRASMFLKKFDIALQKLINDYNGEKLLMQNPDDTLHFQLELGEKRKFENIKIINAIAAAFSFTSGIYYYLNYDRLSQKGIYVEERKEPDNAPKSTSDSIENNDEEIRDMSKSEKPDA
ncbi:MAG TPA: hypothetical protein PLG34_01045 [Spirochaetota bacterium]|jgi:hypothetical protein|nr:MAG: hypothetical protein BWX91_00729 [Spirochaetes bacterium ADurb.Bin133]HNZ26054.1 hypothetical protein [Spirochaetota bacterium]HPY86555.1 hypothetical protein [Spirochaetota bacterium]